MVEGVNVWIILLLALWTIPWKAWAVWLAARRGEKIWLVILLIANTLAILEIIYIFFIAKKKDHKEVVGFSEKE